MLNNKGFTLIEIIVAIGLMSIALGALVFILGTGLEGTFFSSHKNKAIYNAQNLVEENILKEDSESVPGNVEIIFGGKVITSEGKVVIGKGEEKGVSSVLVTFIPDTEVDMSD